jgi:hypothetical protein
LGTEGEELRLIELCDSGGGRSDVGNGCGVIIGWSVINDGAGAMTVMGIRKSLVIGGMWMILSKARATLLLLP